MTKAHISFCKSPYFVWAEAKRRIIFLTRRFSRVKRRVVLLKRRFVISDLQRFTNAIISFLFAMLILNWTISKNHSTIFLKICHWTIILYLCVCIFVASNVNLDSYTSLYPNPANESVNVVCSYKIKDYALVDAMGREVLSGKTAWLWTSLPCKKAFTS